VCAHVTEVAPPASDARLAEVGFLTRLGPELKRVIDGQASGLVAATDDALEAARTIEATINSTLAPLLGHRAPLDIVLAESRLRLAMVTALGWDKATAIRKQTALPERPLLVCHGNPLFGSPRYDYLGPRGCLCVFRGQWRRSRLGRETGYGDREVVALGPRCARCRTRMGEDLRRQIARRTAS
jgi:hypothetical protein